MGALAAILAWVVIRTLLWDDGWHSSRVGSLQIWQLSMSFTNKVVEYLLQAAMAGAGAAAEANQVCEAPADSDMA